MLRDCINYILYLQEIQGKICHSETSPKKHLQDIAKNTTGTSPGPCQNTTGAPPERHTIQAEHHRDTTKPPGSHLGHDWHTAGTAPKHNCDTTKQLLNTIEAPASAKTQPGRSKTNGAPAKGHQKQQQENTFFLYINGPGLQ